MLTIHFTAIITGIAFLLGMKHIDAVSSFLKGKWIFILFATALLLRIIVAYNYSGFSSDTACFYGWANMAYENGLSEFYSSEAFTDYPPGFIYVLWIIGAIFSMCKIPYMSGPCLLLLKLPAILCDIVAGVLIYRLAKKDADEGRATFFTALYLLNPAIFLNSALWGQVDAVFTLCLLLMCLFLTEGKTIPAYIVFGIGVLLKPQILVFTPVLIYGIMDHVILKSFSWRKFFHNLFSGLSVIFCMILVCIPFELGQVISQYTSTLGSYPYIAVNAFNFWGLFGLNWVSQDNKLLFLTYGQWGTVIIIAITLLSAFFFFKNRRNPARYFTVAAFLIISMFLFSVRMHERYLFPALALLLFAYIKKPAREIYLCFTGFTVLHFYNTAYILFFYDPANYNRKAPLFLIVSLLMVLCGLLYYYTLYKYDVLKSPVKEISFSSAKINKATAKTPLEKDLKSKPQASEKQLPFTRIDLLIILLITGIYSCFALYDLGDMKAPATAYRMQQGESIILKTDEAHIPKAVYWYLGNYHNCEFSLEVKQFGSDQWTVVEGFDKITMNSVFSWNYTYLPENCSQMKLTCLSAKAAIEELVFIDRNDEAFMPLNAPEYTTLFDENDLLPEQISFRNSTYFDEIYHARTAYEFLNKETTYETTHPPFGKILISLGIAIFGMNPFGWRIAGTVFGILMLPFLYLLGRSITKERFFSALACLLFAVDFMHFTQTRIATIDVFVTFFIILMYYFMYRYCQMSFYDTPFVKTLLPLGASGIAMGFGVASKWTGAYAGVGLAVLFFATLYRRYAEYKYALKAPKESSNGIKHKFIIQNFKSYTLKTVLFCLVFFVAIPFTIYLLSYIPFVSSHTGLFDKMWHNQELMLGYHSGLEATHPYSSTWYEWPTMMRPIFYYSGIISDTTRQGISAFGNPLVWWIGIPAFLYMIYLALKEKDRTAAMLTISYLAQYLPWCLVPRLTFIYHYFPSVPFVILMIVYAAYKLQKYVSPRTWKICLSIYALLTIGLFIMFYPVLSGQTVSISYVDTFLRWMDSWVLIYG